MKGKLFWLHKLVVLIIYFCTKLFCSSVSTIDLKGKVNYLGTNKNVKVNAHKMLYI